MNDLDVIARTWKDSPRSPITLRDMKKFFAGWLLTRLAHLHYYWEESNKSDNSTMISDPDRDSLTGCLNEISDICTTLEMEKSKSHITSLVSLMLRIGRKTPPTYHAVASAIEGLRSEIEVELGERLLVFIPQSKSQFYEKKELFGPEVNKAFPSAAIDLKDASNCLAFDLNTAAVFHLMRAVEVSMRALARHLKVEIPKGDLEFKEWQIVISGIEKRVEQKLDPKLPPGSPPTTPPLPKRSAKKKSEDREFFRGVIASLHGFKDVWRNPVMHTRNRAKITEPDAMSVYSHVGDFMRRLSERISE